MGVKVKKLVWEDICEGSIRAEAPFGSAYGIDSFYEFSPGDANNRLSLPLGLGKQWFTTIDAAKAAAQADYDRRILSTLEHD